MHLFSAKNLTKSHGGITLFSNITFGIDTGEKVAFIGANGTGKSTLFRILADREEADSGEVLRRSSLKTAYLPQIPVFDPDTTVMDHILNGSSPLLKTLKEYELCLRNLTNGSSAEQELVRLTAEMDRLGAWNLEQSITTVLQQLGIEELDAKMGISIGRDGEKGRTRACAHRRTRSAHA